MPKLACRCGYSFDLITIPSPDGYSIVAESFLDRFHDQSSGSEVLDAIDEQTAVMYKCPVCGRLVVFWERSNAVPDIYLLEHDE